MRNHTEPFSLLFAISQFRGVREVAKNIGLGSHIEVKLARLDKSDQNKGLQCFAINTTRTANNKDQCRHSTT